MADALPNILMQEMRYKKINDIFILLCSCLKKTAHFET